MKIYTYWSECHKAFMSTLGKCTSSPVETKYDAVEELKIATEGSQQSEPKCKTCGDTEIVLDEWADGSVKEFPCHDCNQPEELKPCPFCGSNKISIHSASEYGEKYFGYSMMCKILQGGCGASSGYRDSVQEAYEAWNTRHDAGEE